MEAKYPMVYQYLLSVKHELDKRDKGKPNPIGWYAFGRQQGLETSFGVKLLTSPINIYKYQAEFYIVEQTELYFLFRVLREI